MFTVVTLEDWRVRRILHYIFFWGGQEEDLSSSTRDYLCPLQWKWGVLTTGLPGKSLNTNFKIGFNTQSRPTALVEFLIFE